jgi:simple sugar transport system permease protein
MKSGVIEKARIALAGFGLPRIVILLFIVFLNVMLFVLRLPVALTFSQCLVRVGINIVLALAMAPCVMAGTGMNFALPLGIECGLVAGMISLQFNMTGIGGIAAAMAISVPLSILAGFAYSLLINRVKGSEMMVSTYVGFSIVALMCIGWLILPFNHPSIVWPIGKGLRTTITLDAWYDRALNNLWAVKIWGVDVPFGLFLVSGFFCFLMWLFMRSRTGLKMMAAGANPKYAMANGIKVDSMRTLGTILSTVLGGIGIVIYAQGFGFYQLYNAPLMMAFPAISAVLIGGASPKRISILNVVLGTVMFQTMLAVAVPVASSIIPEGNLSEVVRTIVSNGVILYALSRMHAGSRA